METNSFWGDDYFSNPNKQNKRKMTEPEYKAQLEDIYIKLQEINNRTVFLTAQLKACLLDFSVSSSPAIGSHGDYSNNIESTK